MFSGPGNLIIQTVSGIWILGATDFFRKPKQRFCRKSNKSYTATQRTETVSSGRWIASCFVNRSCHGKQFGPRVFCLYGHHNFCFAPIELIFGMHDLWEWLQDILMPEVEICIFTYFLVAISLYSQYLIPQHFLHKNQFFRKYKTHNLI